MFKNRSNNVISMVLITGLIAGLLALIPVGQAQAQEPYRRGGYGSGVGGAAAGRVYGRSAQAYGAGYQGWSGGVGQGAALGPLSEAEAQALVRAVQEEYGAQALYQSVLETFGDVSPFNLIVRAEAQHAAALERMAEKYGVDVPAYQGTNDLPAYSTLSEACQAGVQAEIADAALYDELMAVTTHADLLRVYTNLQNASLNNHLPAFDACQ